MSSSSFKRNKDNSFTKITKTLIFEINNSNVFTKQMPSTYFFARNFEVLSVQPQKFIKFRSIIDVYFISLFQSFEVLWLDNLHPLYLQVLEEA